jgi:hypothetical protein
VAIHPDNVTLVVAILATGSILVDTLTQRPDSHSVALGANVVTHQFGYIGRFVALGNYVGMAVLAAQ